MNISLIIGAAGYSLSLIVLAFILASYIFMKEDVYTKSIGRKIDSSVMCIQGILDECNKQNNKLAKLSEDIEKCTQAINYLTTTSYALKQSVISLKDGIHAMQMSNVRLMSNIKCPKPHRPGPNRRYIRNKTRIIVPKVEDGNKE